jgi:hypothetical protein
MREIHTCSAKALGIFFFLYGSPGKSRNSIIPYLRRRVDRFFVERRRDLPFRVVFRLGLGFPPWGA